MRLSLGDGDDGDDRTGTAWGNAMIYCAFFQISLYFTIKALSMSMALCI